jgi:putative endonuclease
MRCARQDVDNSDERGHDEADRWTHIVVAGRRGSPSTILMRCARQGVDNSDKRGHDEVDRWTHIVMAGRRARHPRSRRVARGRA